jgi:hypothetical protein
MRSLILRGGSAVTLMLALVGTAVQAHPGVGIVQDSRGNVFFTDLKQVWKITPDGKQSVAVPKVHTHELFLDGEDNLYGEHLWYEGDATKKWGHRVWRLKPDGTLSDIIPTTEGFRTDYSFVRDGKGAMFWADRGTETVIKKRPPDGKPGTHASGGLRQVGWMTATPDGTLYLMDTGDLRRISPDGKVNTVVAKLSGQEKPPAKVSDLNYHMGLWTERDGLVYVAVAAERLVVRVTADGKSSVVAKSSDPWSPSGGMVDRDGNMWLLEYDTNDTARARRIGKDGRDRVFTGESPRR